jgi:hypothetical protein
MVVGAVTWIDWWWHLRTRRGAPKIIPFGERRKDSSKAKTDWSPQPSTTSPTSSAAFSKIAKKLGYYRAGKWFTYLLFEVNNNNYKPFNYLIICILLGGLSINHDDATWLNLPYTTVDYICCSCLMLFFSITRRAIREPFAMARVGEANEPPWKNEGAPHYFFLPHSILLIENRTYQLNCTHQKAFESSTMVQLPC